MVKDTTSCTDEELDTRLESTYLRLDWNTTVDCEALELIWAVLQVLEGVGNLNGKFPRWSQYNGLHLF